jgi:hypothetical protein
MTPSSPRAALAASDTSERSKDAKDFEGVTSRKWGEAVKDRRWLKYRRMDVLAKRMKRDVSERYQALIDTENNLRRW